MSRIAFICASIFLFIFSFSQFAFAENDIEIPVTYDTMQVEIQVLENGNLEITETLTVIFHEERRGIIRHIPTVHTKWFKKTSHPIKLREALRNGEEEERKLVGDLRTFGLRLGDEDIFHTGEHTYEISYFVRDAINFQENYDELYWNISGNDWEDRWKNVETTITFPENINFQNLECFTGDFGSTEQNCEISSNGNTVIASANDYLTIIAQVDKGILEPKGIFYHSIKFILDYFLYIIGIINIVFYTRHSYKNRDLEVGNVIAEFDPPKGMEIEDIMYFYRDASSSLTATTLLVSLAVKGFIKFETLEPKKGRIIGRNKKPTIVIKRLRTDIDELPTAEKRIFTDVLDFENQDITTSTKLSISDDIGKAVQEIRADIRKQKEVHGISFYDPKSYKNDLGTKAFFTIFLPGFFFMIFIGVTSLSGVGILEVIFFGLASFFSIKFASGNFRRTPEAIKMIRHIRGFKEFMHVAERYRSQWQEKTGELTKYLPYAVLFQDTDHWSSVMKEIGEVSTDNLTTSAIGISSISSISAISSSINSSLSSASSSYSSSSSGGGGGGGGGSSW